MLDDWGSNSPDYFHDTQCNDRSCYKSQLLKEQADEDIDAAFIYLKARNDVKTSNSDATDFHIGVMGISYGGAVTVFTNRRDHGQKAVVPFSPGAQQFADETCAPNDASCGTAFQKDLVSAASNAKKAAYYLQAKWDYDTRATIDLAYAHAYGSNDPKHSRAWNAAIFLYKDPCVRADGTSRPCTDDDYQSIHAGFFKDVEKWGPTVLDFLKRNNVK